ncbi:MULTISPECIES: hypothetical protein [Sphingomonas]|uniref:Uncharacterized protein n=2 Tax=Sphingomonas paucimobilis TaxID=13689 RepID=A0A411LHD8_SPHPI|nr:MULTISPECIES: hypothetical protein [Sphingomonas]MBQ1481131.1 hypothetical protein [Sphingomonas sp.]NNG57489.1 hypothetical protein [Sphingomonas paucimobilis]QBE91765.1 hypothetical protein DRN02_006855 [Sphingomonas paucimobilis]QPS16842.1 hypothetical protein I6G65_04130 [Sphingomonas paucimobilis]QPT08316.1 hypothetical protein I6G38_16525 [Sphingomonas paucimobilis]
MTASTIERRRAIFDATGDRRQEQFALASNNVASAPVTLFGGNYVLAQACASYGQIALRYRDPAGNMIQLLTKGGADAGGGTSLQFAAGTLVDVVLTNTTGANVILSRVPNA